MTNRVRDATALGLLLVLMGGIAILDAATGKQVNVWAAYFLPIAFACCITGLPGGVLFSLLAGALLVLVERQVGSPFSEPVYFYIAVANDALAFLVVAYLVSIVRKYVMRSENGNSGDPPRVNTQSPSDSGSDRIASKAAISNPDG